MVRRSSPDTQAWQNDYLQGTGCEMYTETLSPSFTGMSFSQASELCFTKLKLLLLAIEIKGEEGIDSKISINPRSAKIQANTQGFFIAQSADEVKSAKVCDKESDTSGSDTIRVGDVRMCQILDFSRCGNDDDAVRDADRLNTTSYMLILSRFSGHVQEGRTRRADGWQGKYVPTCMGSLCMSMCRRAGRAPPPRTAPARRASCLVVHLSATSPILDAAAWRVYAVVRRWVPVFRNANCADVLQMSTTLPPRSRRQSCPRRSMSEVQLTPARAERFITITLFSFLQHAHLTVRALPRGRTTMHKSIRRVHVAGSLRRSPVVYILQLYIIEKLSE
ncbi:Calcium-activated potassium channel slowpoke [Eumeta japonica]|uniref:Calcium-activated potassium channel slowpoke n=1 Tax=Eumeta variegata TaxID=151549 RepID=A0A4C1TXZ4_EUMVA|nr:Calcium-activated potassium channel slowpoke [Eumeta japonica]